MKITPKSVHVMHESVRLVWTDEKTERVKQIVIHNCDARTIAKFQEGADKGLKIGAVTFEWVGGHEMARSVISVDATDAKKKWRWHQVGDTRWNLALDGERVPFGCVTLRGQSYSVHCAYMATCLVPEKDQAMGMIELDLKASSYWREGDEIEPYKEPVPTLVEWMDSKGFGLHGSVLWKHGCGFVGMEMPMMKEAHAAITEYFAKYPDAEPELRREWEK